VLNRQPSRALLTLPGMISLAVLAAANPLPAAELSGQVTLVSPSGRASRGIDLSAVVVAYVPDSQHQTAPTGEPYQMITVGKSFEPSVLVIEEGAEVVFPNHDPILHNVFSLTPDNDFDLGLYGRGEGRTVTFSTAGLVRVFCNVHRDMVAHILVVASSFFTRADSNGRFALSGLPAGTGQLILWHPRAELESRQSMAPETGLSLTLAAKRRRVPKHFNKFGKPYRSRRDRYGR